MLRREGDRRVRARTPVAVGFVAMMLLSCSDSGANSLTGVDGVADAKGQGWITSLSVEPEQAVIDVGGTVTLTATATDVKGRERPATVTWSSSEPGVAAVSGAGVVSGVSEGTAVIRAWAGSVSDSAIVTVVGGVAVASVEVSPASGTVNVGESLQLTATVRDADGNVLEGRSVTWASSSTAIATVDDGGLVLGVAAGAATITAASGGHTGLADVTVGGDTSGSGLANECASPQTGWIWCDDFSQDRLSSYFEYDDAGGRFARQASTGIDGSTAMRATYLLGQSNAGSLKLAFGATPSTYIRPVDAGTAKYREVYWRMFVRNDADWTGGGGDKLSRGMVFANANWAEAAIGHVWSGGSNHKYLALDPASGTDTEGNLKTTKYNDFANLRWLGAQTGITPLFAASNVGKWHCVETRMRLNDAGQSNGVFEQWIDGTLDAQITGLNWLGSYDTYGINALFIENYWNDGAPKQQSRHIDNIVVSTRPIGCGGGTVNATQTVVATVTVSPASATMAPEETTTLTATAKDADGNTISGETFTWTSSNTAVATVDASGVVTARQAGSATITAAVDGHSGSASVTVSSASSSAWLEMNFDSYSSTAALLEDCTRWNCVEQSNTGRIILDTSVAPPGGSRSMRYHYRHGGNGCNSITIQRTLPAPARTQEIWAEFQVRWSDNFRTTNDACVPNDHKLIFGDTEADENGRWAFYVGADTGPDHTLMVERPLGPNGFLGAYYPNNSGGLRASDLWDGQWHTVRLYYRASSGPTVTDGAMKVWIDGALIHSETGFATRTENGGRDYITGFSFAHNKDDGPPNEDMYLWWGRIRYWQNNPGW